MVVRIQMEGNPCTKDAMIRTIIRAAEFLGLPRETADGLEHWTGNTLRINGAQGLAAAGLDTWAIQLLGRWGSTAVLGYIREAPLITIPSWAQRVGRNQTLDSVVADW